MSKSVLLLLFSIISIVSQGQLLDYRNGSIETKEGVVMNGKLGYSIFLRSKDYLRFKSSNGKVKMPMSNIKRFTVNNQNYRVIQASDSGSYRAGPLIVGGDIEAVEVQNKYYLVYHDSIYFLDNTKKERDVGGGKVMISKSGLYMVTLNKLFRDCRLNYTQIGLKLKKRTLTSFLDSVAHCRKLQFTSQPKLKKWQVGVIGGVGLSTFNQEYLLGGTTSNPTNYFTMGVTFTRDLIGVNKLKLRMDINFKNNKFTGSKSWIRDIDIYPLGPTEFVHYNLKYSNIDIPIGLQYYLFSSQVGMYINAGGIFYGTFDSKMNFGGYELLASGEYIPKYQNQGSIRGNDSMIAGYWVGGGFEFNVKERFAAFIEFRYEENTYVRAVFPGFVLNYKSPGIDDLQMIDLSCKFGLRMKL